ncbi:MAG: alanyl-tRNA editing protein [Planctomycetota bacterium]
MTAAATTHRVYLVDASQLELTATVREVAPTDDPARWRVRLDRTIFHPQGGGQKADRGTIGSAEVVGVSNAPDGDVDHIVAGDTAPLAVGDEVALRVDEPWRSTNARYHSAGHLIAALVEARFPSCHATSGHHWPGEARVEFDIAKDSPAPDATAIQAALEPDLVTAINENLPVRVVGDPFTARAVQIAEHAPVPCGGTHVPAVGALGAVSISRVRIKSGKLRVSYGVD